MIQKLPPDVIASLGAVIGVSLTDMAATQAQAVLGGTLGNVVGHIPDEQWEQMKAVAYIPCDCGNPNCQDIARKTFEALDLLRKDWKNEMGEDVGGADEKGFSE